MLLPGLVIRSIHDDASYSRSRRGVADASAGNQYRTRGSSTLPAGRSRETALPAVVWIFVIRGR